MHQAVLDGGRRPVRVRLLGSEAWKRDRAEVTAVKYMGIIRCADCGAELNRTVLIDEPEKGNLAFGSAFAAGKCPNGCRSTFSDLNINTTLHWEANGGNTK
jgi:hypothetical protein